MADLNDLFNEASVVGEESEEIDWLVISHDFRTITIPSNKKLGGVTSDEKVNRLYFKCPRTYGDVDLNDFMFRINYTNASGEGDMYLATDKIVSGDEIQFSWLVGRHACEYAGNISFVVCAIETDNNSTILREYNTAIHTLQVVQGLETSEEIHDEVLDVVAQMQGELDGLDETVSQLVVDDLAPIVDTLVDADLWQIGHIMSSTGVDSDSPTYNRMRTKTFIPENIMQIATDVGYGFYIFCYSKSDGSYLGMWDGATTVKSWVYNWCTGTVSVKELQNNYRIRILANRQGGAAPQLTPEDNAQMFRFISFTDESLSIAGKAADAKVVGERLTALNDVVTEKASGIINTASGTIAFFNDGADGMPIKKLVAQIEPVQDLHGYDHPWPAGGGKNLYASPSEAVTDNGVTLTPNEDESITLSGQANSAAGMFYSPVDIPSGSTITIGLNNTDVNADIGVRLLSTASAGSGTQYGTMVAADAVNKKLTFTSSFAAKSINVFAKTNHGEINNITLKIMVELGSTSGAFEPYENRCPISGWTGLSGKRTGKNLLPYPNATPVPGSRYTAHGVKMTRNNDGTLSFTGTATEETWFYFNKYTADGSRNFNFKPGNYILTSEIEDDLQTQYRLQMTTYKYNPYRILRPYIDIGAGVNITINDDETEAIYVYVPSGKNMDGITIKPMLRLASDTDATFEPYIAQDVSVNWQDTAGTVYGGYIDVVSGQMTLTHKTFEIDGVTTGKKATFASTWNNDTSHLNAAFGYGDNGYDAKYAYGSNEVVDCISDIFTPTSYNGVASISAIPKYGIFALIDGTPTQSSKIRTCIPKSLGITTVDQMNDWIASNGGFSITYRLLNPIVYQLTPQEVTTLLGTNNIWADVGPVSVEYQADTKMYIVNKIAEAISALNA